jgi:hypothetical protein
MHYRVGRARCCGRYIACITTIRIALNALLLALLVVGTVRCLTLVALAIAGMTASSIVGPVDD